MTSSSLPTGPREPQAMTTAGLQAKVQLRGAWFAAHPNQPIPEGSAQVEALFAAIEAEAAAPAGDAGLREERNAVLEAESIRHDVELMSLLDAAELRAERAALAANPPTAPDAEVARLREALEWAMAPNPRHEGRHRTEPRCRTFMPTDADCSCGYEQARRALVVSRLPVATASTGPTGLDPELLAQAMRNVLDQPHGDPLWSEPSWSRARADAYAREYARLRAALSATPPVQDREEGQKP